MGRKGRLTSLCHVADSELEKIVEAVSEDKKDMSLEYNEYLKMMATDLKKDPTQNKDALLEAFRWLLLTFASFSFWLF